MFYGVLLYAASVSRCKQVSEHIMYRKSQPVLAKEWHAHNKCTARTTAMATNNQPNKQTRKKCEKTSFNWFSWCAWCCCQRITCWLPLYSLLFLGETLGKACNWNSSGIQCGFFTLFLFTLFPVSFRCTHSAVCCIDSNQFTDSSSFIALESHIQCIAFDLVAGAHSNCVF